MPNVPTVAESGFKDFEADIWFGLVAPVKTPAEVISQLGAWFTAALRTRRSRRSSPRRGYSRSAPAGPQHAAFTKKQYDDYGRAIRDANIKAQ